jgi:hypothetical protein
MMAESIDFATKVAGTGKYANVDATKIMAAGFSCGGVEAMAQSWDPRVKTIGIFSSGLLTNYTAASTFNKPILYVIGGSGDVAYANASSPPPIPAVDMADLELTRYTPYRPRETLRLFQPAPRFGRVTFPSDTVVISSLPTAASSAVLVSPGWSTTLRATRRRESTSRAILLATKPMVGPSRSAPWISSSRWCKKEGV